MTSALSQLLIGNTGAPKVTIVIKDSTIQTDSRDAGNPFIVGEWQGKTVRIVVDMLPDVLKEAIIASKDISGGSLEANVAQHLGCWYGFFIVPNTVLTADISISLKSGRNRGAPLVHVTRMFASVVLAVLEEVVIANSKQLDVPARKDWPSAASTAVQQMLAQWEHSKLLSSNGKAEALFDQFRARTSLFDISYGDHGLAAITYARVDIMVCYLADLEDPEVMTARIAQAEYKLDQLLAEL